MVVGSDPDEGRGRGVVSTANYEARKYGIRSALPISTAWKLAEAARKKGGAKTYFIAPDFTRYSASSKEVMKILSRFSRKIEEASVDEAYFDLSHLSSWKEAEIAARRVKEKVQQEQHLTCSVGVGPNKMVAKIAAGIHKPDGLLVVPEEEVVNFLAPLSVDVLPGVGKVTEKILFGLRIKNVQDLRELGSLRLTKALGKTGRILYERAWGRDDRELSVGDIVKSIGEQETFLRDVVDSAEVIELVTKASLEVFERMKKEGFTSFRTVVVTVRFADFETKNRSHTFPLAISDERILIREAFKLLLPFFDSRENPERKAIRLAGVRIEKLTIESRSLFD